MPVVYISGPMRGLPGLNFAAFNDAEERARRLGWVPINPARPDANAPLDTSCDAASLRYWARRDIDLLLSMRQEDGDAIAMLPGWYDSKGSRAEYAVAVWLGLTVLDAITFRSLEKVASDWTVPTAHGGTSTSSLSGLAYRSPGGR